MCELLHTSNHHYFDGNKKGPFNKEINAGLADPAIKARLADLGATPFGGPPTDFGKHIADETEKWAKVIKFAGAKVY